MTANAAAFDVEISDMDASVNCRKRRMAFADVRF